MEKPGKEKQAELRERFVGSQGERQAKYREQMTQTSKREDAPDAPPKAVTSDDLRTVKKKN